jgi:hypothetical protein
MKTHAKRRSRDWVLKAQDVDHNARSPTSRSSGRVEKASAVLVEGARGFARRRSSAILAASLLTSALYLEDVVVPGKTCFRAARSG